MNKRIGLGLTNSVRTRVGRVSVLGCDSVGGVGGEWVGGLHKGLEG